MAGEPRGSQLSRKFRASGGMLVSRGCAVHHHILGDLKQNFIFSRFWGPEVCRQVGDRTALLGSGAPPSPPPGSVGCDAPWLPCDILSNSLSHSFIRNHVLNTFQGLDSMVDSRNTVVARQMWSQLLRLNEEPNVQGNLGNVVFTFPTSKVQRGSLDGGESRFP